VAANTEKHLGAPQMLQHLGWLSEHDSGPFMDLGQSDGTFHFSNDLFLWWDQCHHLLKMFMGREECSLSLLAQGIAPRLSFAFQRP